MPRGVFCADRRGCTGNIQARTRASTMMRSALTGSGCRSSGVLPGARRQRASLIRMARILGSFTACLAITWLTRGGIKEGVLPWHDPRSVF